MKAGIHPTLFPVSSHDTTPVRGARKITRRWLVLLGGLGAVVLVIFVIFPSCGFFDPPVGDSPAVLNPIRRAAGRQIFLMTEPAPESEWNGMGLWQKIGSSPPTYVPKGYASKPPVGNAHGTWFVDERDGKRLFAPDTSYRNYPPQVWAAEARGITGYDKTRRVTH